MQYPPSGQDQQLNTYYPPQGQYPPYTPPPYIQPDPYSRQPVSPPQRIALPRKKNTPVWIAAFVAAIIVVAIISNIGQFLNTTGISTGGTWVTTHTFTGTGNQQTAIFNVSGDWKIVYSCSYQQTVGAAPVDGAFGVTVHYVDSIAVNASINTRCTSTNTAGEVEEHQGGSVYLEIDAATDGWKIQIQELK